MSEAITTTRPAESAGRGAGGPRRRPARPHVWAFNKLISMRVALLILLGIALLTLAGTLLVQAPSGLSNDPKAYSEWLNSIRPKYGGWTDILDTLGLFSVFSSIYFKGLLILLSASLISCSVRRAPRIWRTATRPRMVMTEAFFERAPNRAKVESETNPGAALARLRSTFRSHHFHTKIETHGDTVHICADRFRWGPFGRIIAHVSFVVILLGATLTATDGFRNESFAVPVGSRVPVGGGTGLAVEATSFADTYYTSGPPRDFASHLVLYKNGARVDSQEVRVNHPLTYDGTTFYQSFFGPAQVIQAKTPQGKVLFEGGVPLLYSSSDEKHRIGRFILPHRDLAVFVVSPNSGEVDPRIPAGATQLELYRGQHQAPVAVRVLSQGKRQGIDGVDFTFVREHEFTGLIVARDPGSTFVWIGSALLVLGICMVFLFPHRRIRAAVRRRAGGTDVQIAAIRRHDPNFAAQFERLVEDVRGSLAPAPPQPEKGR